MAAEIIQLFCVSLTVCDLCYYEDLEEKDD